MKNLVIIFVILMFSATITGQSKYKTYNNARFGYSISYPADLLKPEAEAENGDGRIFLGTDAEMRVFGSNLLMNETLPKEYRAILREKGRSVTYKVLKSSFFVISGKENERIFYQKTMGNSEGAFITFMIEYDESKRVTYDKVVTKIVKSFK